VTCAACGFANPTDSRFCGECGVTLALSCPSCGAAHESGQKFCRACGATLAGAAKAANPASPASREPTPNLNPAPAELRFVSVLFVDLVGFTALSEGREAEDVRELLSRYFDVTRSIVERYGGSVEKFIGDAVMAVWGAPAAREDDAERAVRAALEIVDAVNVFGAEVGAAELRARAGVVTGQAAAVDNPGEGIVAGDRVNTASRVQAAAEPGAVLVDGATHRLAEAAILFEDSGEHQVKGKTEPLRLWRAMRVVAGAGGRDREGLLDVPVVGRDGELRLLKELLDQTVERAGARLVAVSGEAGIGKSRLRREFSNYTDGLARQFLWHTGRCLAHGDGVAYWALAEMVRQRLGIAEDAPTAEAAAKLDAGLREWIVDGEEREYIHPRLGALLGVTSPGLDRAELLAGWRLFIERLAGQDPVILVFEDMQWADDGLLTFIDQILDWSRSVPIFMLTLARPELAALHDGWPSGRRGVTTIDLEALSDSEVAELLNHAVDGLPGATRDQIVARAQGNPLYALETVRALADRGVLTQQNGRLVAAEPAAIGELDIPASLNALLAARLDALEPGERDLVKAMSVFGGSFPLQAVISLTGLEAGQVEPLLEALVRKQVFVIFSDPLSPDRGQYAFAQGLLRTVAYESVGRRLRKQLHLAAAAHLRAAFPNEGEDVAEVIADHMLAAFEATGDQDDDHADLRGRVVDALKRSAERSESVGAPLVAVAALTRAADFAAEQERPDLLEQAGWLAGMGAHYEQALELGEHARRLYAAAGREREAALAERRTLEALRNLGRAGEWVARLQAAVDTLTPLVDGPDAGLAELQFRLGRALAFAGDYERATQSHELALIAAEALELHEVLAATLESRASAYSLFLGRSQEARIFYQAAIVLAERHGLLEVLHRANSNFALYSSLWNPTAARELLERHLEVARRRGDMASAVVTTDNLGEHCIRQGDWARAHDVVEDLRERDLGEYEAALLALPPLMLALLRGDLASARVELELIAPLEQSDDPWDRVIHATNLVLFAAAQANHQEALARGLELLGESAKQLGGTAYAPDWDAWPQILGSALALGDDEAAHGLIARFAQRPPGHMPPYWRAHLARGQGLVAVADDDLDTAEAQLRAAAEQFVKIDSVYWSSVADVDLADLLIRQGRGEEAVPLLAAAIALFEQLGAAPALAHARDLAGRIERDPPQLSAGSRVTAPS
jgi:class 3 adenylate cyclase/tetratricopeptide (TPR) repeat protein